MRVRRTDILPLAEAAIRDALREAVREALRDVALEGDRTHELPAEETPESIQSSAPFTDLSDEEAWERFDSIRFARFAGMSREKVS